MLLTKQIGKVLRAVNTRKSIKLNLNGLLTRGGSGLDFILSGLRGNEQVNEIDLTANGLENEDLARLCEHLEGDSLVSRLRLGNNQFSDPSWLIDLMRTNASVYTHLDLSQIPFEGSTL